MIFLLHLLMGVISQASVPVAWLRQNTGHQLQFTYLHGQHFLIIKHVILEIMSQLPT